MHYRTLAQASALPLFGPQRRFRASYTRRTKGWSRKFRAWEPPRRRSDIAGVTPVARSPGTIRPVSMTIVGERRRGRVGAVTGSSRRRRLAQHGVGKSHDAGVV